MKAREEAHFVYPYYILVWDAGELVLCAGYRVIGRVEVEFDEISNCSLRNRRGEFVPSFPNGDGMGLLNGGGCR
jgi:hypothetical protein